jgi:hypothetical protein
MALPDELAQAAATAGSFGTVSAVLAAEPHPGVRSYLVALGEVPELGWLVLDADFAPVAERARVREVASIVVLCELAAELAADGELAELRPRLVAPSAGAAVSTEALAALGALEQLLGDPPRLASAAFLDELGAALVRLELALAGYAPTLARALASHSETVEAFVEDVERSHRVPLR